jgi:AcrR family transcriptional regulator
MSRTSPLLHRDDPDKEPLVGNVKVTREDWLNVALDVMISEGIDQVKVLVLGERLGVSRSSFYWYFKTRQDLLDALLDRLHKANTAAMVERAGAPAPSITAAVCNVFHCAVNTSLFDTDADFALRDWARRSGAVRHVQDMADEKRLGALTAMFARYDYDADEAFTRARVLYYMQIGYNTAELHEPMAERLRLIPFYLKAFTGREPGQKEIDDFHAYVREMLNGDKT